MKNNIDELKLFRDNAHLLLQHAEEILSDRRMRFAPVPVENSLAYIGENGLQSTVLGVYIEWWLNCEASVTANADGNKGLLYHFSGSPLSGSNQCHYIFPDGTELSKHNDRFREAWSSFRKLNLKYVQHIWTIDSYSLTEVIDRLTNK